MEGAATETTLHGVLVDVYGIGVLLLGESGTGKSECALDLVTRGHRLVADDVVEVARESDRIVIGRGPSRIGHHMEIRGLGIINIRDLFGVAAIRHRKRIELVVLLEAWRPEDEYDRLGVEEQTYPILGVAIPMLRIPVSAGRNVAILVEVAARNHLLKLMGVHAARNFAAQLSKRQAGETQDADLPRFSQDDTE
ncbi:MAG: HPr(Ser) kinase/phosphatase [candidate division NC10 bacterium]|nr:HPr(Ser) kinase/phosphatase [candidate division NC10 bacterium]MBI2458877.1 HPr(Ser) kinase/phosphatase [candidate division NC10 bacterium]MBI3085423.1 HPr(Ser) kinase/phosphatase [candidate division NC10 bacterium]MBI3121704.1 HPr(Ser) kinase/phosphatase [candidate division NC10 bacterium]